jgi:predicted nucleic acid-binding protein
MIVVCDTSPVNYLVLIDEIDLLPQLFTTVVLPAGVLAELQHPRTPSRVASWARELPPWVRVISPEGAVGDVGLGRGEAEAIAVATQIAADTALIDERKATVVARQRGRDARTIWEKQRMAVISQYDPGGSLSYGINCGVWFS